MPRKPDKTTLDACKAKIDAHGILQTIINETPILNEAIGAAFENEPGFKVTKKEG